MLTHKIKNRSQATTELLVIKPTIMYHSDGKQTFEPSKDTVTYDCFRVPSLSWIDTNQTIPIELVRSSLHKKIYLMRHL